MRINHVILIEQEPERDDLLPKVEAFMKFPTWGVVIGAAMWFVGAFLIWLIWGPKLS